MTRKYKEFIKQKVSKAKQIIQVALEKVSKSKVDDLISVLAEKFITFGLATSHHYFYRRCNLWCKNHSKDKATPWKYHEIMHFGGIALRCFKCKAVLAEFLILPLGHGFHRTIWCLPVLETALAHWKMPEQHRFDEFPMKWTWPTGSILWINAWIDDTKPAFWIGSAAQFLVIHQDCNHDT